MLDYALRVVVVSPWGDDTKEAKMVVAHICAAAASLKEKRKQCSMRSPGDFGGKTNRDSLWYANV